MPEQQVDVLVVRWYERRTATNTTAPIADTTAAADTSSAAGTTAAADTSATARTATTASATARTATTASAAARTAAGSDASAGNRSGAAVRWLAAAEAHLPEAAPRRFGETEPLRQKGDLAAAYARSSSLLFLAGTPPIYHASLSAGGPGRVAVHSMHVVLPPDDERVRAFALAMTHPETVYVSASVSRGQTLDGNTLWGPGEQREEPYLAPRGEWLGLPPHPPEWCWFGPAYTRLLKRNDPLWTEGPWVPPPLRARLDEPDPIHRHARRIPRGLRPPLWRRIGF